MKVKIVSYLQKYKYYKRINEIISNLKILCTDFNSQKIQNANILNKNQGPFKDTFLIQRKR